MATTDKATGIGTLYCPGCNEIEATFSLDLGGLAEFECKDCGETFSRKEMEEQIEEMRGRLAKWTAVLAWIDTAPSD